MKVYKSLASASLVAALAVFVAPTIGRANVGSTETEVLERISGENRMATAVEISQDMFTDDHSVHYAVVVSGETHADALAAGPLARLKGGPLLLTSRDMLDDVTRDELDRVLNKDVASLSNGGSITGQLGEYTSPEAKVIIVGGESAVSQDVEDEILAIRGEGKLEVMRIEGADRYDTALNVALFMDQIRGESAKWAFLANGEAYADAMAASAIASNKNICDSTMPILLTRQEELSDSTASYLGQVAAMTGEATTPKLEKVYVLGGEVRISEDIVTYLDQFVMDVTRIAGPNRYGTAANLAETFFGVDNPPSKIGIARGDDFADALAAGPFMGKHGGPLLLVEPNVLPDETYSYLLGHKDHIKGGWVLGGVEAVIDGVKTAVEDVYMD